MGLSDLIAWLRTDEAGTGELAGCSEAEIEELCVAQGVDHLPADYVDYLRIAGRYARSFDKGYSMSYPHLKEEKLAMVESIATCDHPFELPPRSFVFLSHGGYNWWYFADVAASEPVVTNWIDMTEFQQPQPMFRTFAEFALVWMEMIRTANRRYEEWLATGQWPAASPPIRVEAFRTIPAGEI